jgi:hypothetical protein
MSNFGPAQFGPAVFGGEPAAVIDLEHGVDAEITNYARRLIARGMTDGTAIQIIDFSLGQGGLDPFDYETATPVNPDAQQLELPLIITPATGPAPTVPGAKPITEYERPNEHAGCAYCQLDVQDQLDGDTNATLSEIGIWGQIIWSPYTIEIGDTFLAAIGHFPLICKTGSWTDVTEPERGMAYAFRVNVQF